ncbi:Ubiquitin-conjugating enzyme family protein [Rhynchospora pubera]|uniref:E2 ubiquitin-conjugating enzyme n=1 Tax=Rhynchospora pubera TaxID=906938 RepID=A0AAV8AR32_9POAL|nr:Ubiquitin-conjugating enzyme family protein [Rhynchospora pubera]KAJ4749425.1 Ubiquitin-conjugating enzyme family protein [Rhynchospora pubera]
MDPGATSNWFSHSSKMNRFPGTLSYSDPDIIEVTSSTPWSSNNQKRKRSQQVIPHDVIQIDEDDDPDGVVILGETLPNHKKKQPLSWPNYIGKTPVGKIPVASQHPIDWQMNLKDAFGLFAGPSSSTPNASLPGNTASVQTPVPSLQDFNFADYEYFKDDDFFEDDYDDFEYENAEMDTEPSFNLEAKFDGWTGVGASAPWLQKCFASASGSGSGSRSKQPKVVNDEIDINYKGFKQFDTVRDYSDHYFMSKFKTSQKPSKEWTRRIQNDWKLLEKDLPESIFVRIYEDRMDLLRAVIIGPAGTPYHDGLFFFDVYFPPTYPFVPPMVHYHSGGLRLNPNLYACGKVCLSLLNTWSGSGCEKWNPANSTMLQVLVSIQALVLNSKPYFNEPGYSAQANTPYGEQKSLAYNENTFLLSCKTMLYSLRRAPKHFEHFVAGHFRRHGNKILVACRAYMEGAQVGCLVGDGVQDVDEGDKSSSHNFKASLKRIFDDLLMEFTVKGADCDEFLTKKPNQGPAAVPPPRLNPTTMTRSPFGGPFTDYGL